MNLILNEIYLESLGEQKAAIIQAAVQGGVAGWGSLFWQAKGMLPRNIEPNVEEREPGKNR